MSKKILFLVVIIFASLRGEIISFDYNNFQIDLQAGKITAKSFKSNFNVYYNSLKLPSKYETFQSNNSFPLELKIINLEKRFVGSIPSNLSGSKSVEIGKIDYDNIPLKIDGAGIMRNKGLYNLISVPFIVEDNNLYFVEKIEYNFSKYKYFETPKYSIDEQLDMIIITSREFENLFDSYRKFKQKQGIEAEIKVLEDIYDNYDGISFADKIRNYIKEVYLEKNVKFVLLGGGYKVLPTVELFGRTNEKLVPSDHYYSNLDGNLDENNNGILAEVADNPDLYPDLFVGRFPANTITELESIIDKTISYYEGGPSDNDNFYNSLLTVGFDLEPENPDGGSTQPYCLEIMNTMPDSYQNILLSEDNPFTFNQQAVLEHLNKGYNFVYANAHGSYIKFGQPGGWGIYSDHILNTDNFSGIYVISSCNPGSFTYPGISHKAMTSAQGGCVNYYGSSGKEWPSLSDGMLEMFFEKCLDGYPLGEAMSEARIAQLPGLTYSSSHYRFLYFSYNLQGDPSNVMIVDNPEESSITEVSPIVRGSGIVEGSLEFEPSQKTILTMIADDKIISSGRVTGTEFSIPYENLAADSVILAVSSPTSFVSCQKYKTEVNTEQEIVVSNLRLEDDNYNDVVESGEDFSISFEIKTIINSLQTDSLLVIVSPIDNDKSEFLSDTATIKFPAEGTTRRFNPFKFNYQAETFFKDSVLSLQVSFGIISKIDNEFKPFLNKIVDLPISSSGLVLGWVNYLDNNSKVKVSLLNLNNGIIKKGEISLFKEEELKESIILRNIPGKSVITDSLEFAIDDAHASYHLRIKINDGNYYQSKSFNLTDTPVLNKLNLEIFSNRDIINLEWNIVNSENYKYNVYLYSQDTLSVPEIINPYPLTIPKFQFTDTTAMEKFVQISIIDSSNNELAFSACQKIEIIKQYLDSPYSLSPFQLYNPVFIDNKIFANGQNSAIVGLSNHGETLGDNGLIYNPPTNGFNSSTTVQSYAIGDIDNNGNQDFVNYYYLSGDSVRVQVTDLVTGNILASKNIYGYIIETAPVLVDYDNNGDLEIMITVFNGNLGGENEKGAYVYLLDYKDHQLKFLPKFPIFSPYDSYNVHSASFLDLDGDGDKEFIFDNRDTIVVFDGQSLEQLSTFELSSKCAASLSYADLDSDGDFEVFAVSESQPDIESKLYSFDFIDNELVEFSSFGTEHQLNTSVPSGYNMSPGAMFADIDDDGSTECIVLTSKMIYVFNADGSNYRDFPIDLKNKVNSVNFTSPTMADFDGDNFLDFLYMDSEFKIWCYSGNDGKILSGFPIKVTDIDRFNYGNLPVADLDKDGDLEFGVGTGSGLLLIYDYPLQTSDREIRSYYRGDLYNSGIFAILSPQNVKIFTENNLLKISWNPVEGATGYKIYSSNSPTEGFTEDNSGFMSDAVWTAPLGSERKKFYRVAAVK